MDNSFELFGISHLIIFVFIIFSGTLFVSAVKLNFIKEERMRKFLLTLSIITYLFFYSSKIYFGWLDIHTDLPMHLCDWAFICSIIVLSKPSQFYFELAYFWGLGGTLQALLTPDLNTDFPHIGFFIFFSTHCMIIINIVFMVFAMKLRPYPISIVRVFIVSQVYFIAALLVNLTTGSNYGFIMEKPLNPTLLDYLGPHPWYLLSLEFVALLSFAFYYLPFYLRDKIALRKKNY